MMKPAFLDDLMEKISAVLPADCSALKEDTRRNIRDVLQSVFQKMDLLTREDFEQEKKQLAEAQARLETLIEQIKCLEMKSHEKK